MIRSYADIPEGQIHYRTEGKGEPLLLLHQTAFSSDEYTEMIPILSKYYRVIAMDTLGYGSSDKPPRQFTIEDYGLSIIHFLDALKIKKTNVVGHHTGATLAGEIAATYPGRINKVVMSGISLYTPQEREEFLKHPMFAPMQIREDGLFLMELWEFLRKAYLGFKPEVIYRMFVANLEAGPRLHDAHYAAFRYNKEPKLPLIECPTLIMCGSEDMFFKNLDRLQKIIPKSRKAVVQGAGNAIAYQKPAEFAQVIIDFLKG